MSEHMDNFAFDVTAKSRATFDLAMMIATSDNSEATHYAVLTLPVKSNEWTKEDKRKRGTLVLFRGPGMKEAVPFPHPLKHAALTEFVWDWLRHMWETGEAGDEPDHDGSNSHGYRIFNEEWGHVAGHFEAFVAIQPVWAMHGK